MNKDFAPLAVEGIDPWDGLEIEPDVRRLAEHAAQAAGLSVEEWLERAVRQACAAVLPSLTGERGDLHHEAAGLHDDGEMNIAAAPIGRWAMDIADEPPPSPLPAARITDLERAPEPPLPPVIADEAWDPAPVSPLPEQPMMPTPGAPKSKASWTIIERLAQQQTTRRAPMRLVRRDPDAPAHDAASPLPPLPPEDPFIPATPLTNSAGATLSFDDHLAAATASDGAAGVSPRVQMRPEPVEAGRAVSSAWRQWLLMAVSCVVALGAGMLLAPIVFRTSPPEDTHHASAELSPRANTAVAELPKRPVDAADASAAAPPATPPASPPPPVTVTAMPDTPGASMSTSSPAAAANPPPAPAPVAPATADVAPKPAPPPAPLPPTKPAIPAAAANGTPPSATAGNGPVAASPDGGATDAPNAPPRKTAMARPPAEPAPHKQDAKPKALDNEPAPSDPKKLAAWLEDRAKSGDPASQYRLGVLYVQGQTVPQDYQRASTLFRAAAEAGIAEAQYNVAVMYNEGMGMPRDLTQAVFWYQKAAAQGNANAAFNLGVAYANGSGVEQNMEEAARWFRRAGSQGVTNAQFNLALLYERGEGVPVSQVEAYAWYAAAAANKDAGAGQRRDKLAAAMSPSELKEAQARAAMLQQSIQDPGKEAAIGKP
jgi:TPR repeat protein